MIGGGGRRSRRSVGSEAMPLLRSPTKHDMARVVQAAQCATIRAAGSRGQGRSALKIDSEAFDRAKRVLRSPIKKRGSGSQAASLPRCQPSRQKPAHRFAQSGHESGYIFELGFVFSNNPSILGFFVPQFDSCNKSRMRKMRV